MEVHFSAEQEAQISQIALHQGTDPMQLVKDAALRLLSEEQQYRAVYFRAGQQQVKTAG